MSVRKIANTLLILSVLLIILGAKLFIPSIIVLIIKGNIQLIKIIFGIIFLVIGIKALKIDYQPFIIANRNTVLSNKLNTEERELVQDAVDLIKKVDEKINISQFNVYKVILMKDGLFSYDPITHELNIYIPFKRYIKYNKDILFQAIVHEILHTQNLKENIQVFNNDFLEGLNQYLAEWLINNYSEKYEVPKKHIQLAIYIGNGKELLWNKEYNIYKEQVNVVRNILEESNANIKEIFLKYIDFDPIYFVDYVPVEYFKIDKK